MMQLNLHFASALLLLIVSLNHEVDGAGHSGKQGRLQKGVKGGASLEFDEILAVFEPNATSVNDTQLVVEEVKGVGRAKRDNQDVSDGDAGKRSGKVRGAKQGVADDTTAASGATKGAGKMKSDVQDASAATKGAKGRVQQVSDEGGTETGKGKRQKSIDVDATDDDMEFVEKETDFPWIDSDDEVQTVKSTTHGGSEAGKNLTAAEVVSGNMVRRRHY